MFLIIYLFFVLSQISHLFLNDAKYFRDFSHFDSNSFLSDVEAIDFCGLVHDDINQSINDLVDMIQRNF